ncbi:NAD-dependent epimerase/dehydratase family protein [Bradyrhizobium sp. WSM 1738]|uniref:NAD-dependent epimerase/dehydratase family protein n=1 Tax=Bradyrhizobium hereditatis TaxID=2821405 RepID=UPI001CE2D847|nr:NAD-dependent epimerase/dehydratase family protein [Bradyrhizobium hereditatis]MCA6119204.1 NAD-dependent epimerase/dehydratase family protein [Bradyrhizobium hereditatis]
MTFASPNIKNSSERILVTGGCGFLGCNIAAKLATRGRSVVAMDNLSRRGSEENAEWLRQRYGNRVAIEIADTRDADAVDALVSANTAVMHLAAQVAVTTSLEDPISDFEINGHGTLNVLQAIRRRNPRAPIVFASTNKVYGRLFDPSEVRRVDCRYVPDDPRFTHGVAEDTPLDLYSPYGCSKGVADQYVRDYSRVFALRSVVLRMSCVYGPRQFGNEDQGWIAHFLLEAIRRRPITIYGDGYQVRDALFVDDAVNAWIAALDNINSISGRIFNLGGGPSNAISLRDLLQLISELRGDQPDVRYAAWRPGDQPWYVSDIRAVSQAVEWEPRVSVRQGLRLIERWLDNHVSAGGALASELLEARV